MPKWLPYAAIATLAVLALSHRGAHDAAPSPDVAQTPVAPQDTGAPVHGHWGYAGAEGPKQLGELSPESYACAEGGHRTPVDIRAAVEAPMPALVID